jgi:membrane protein YqaA with SNARE-associated domain
MAANLIAFIWGLAEATLFFIVPDVALSIIALKGINLGLVACLYALSGALAGGTIMFYWGRADIEKVSRILIMIPAIRPKDIERIRSDLQKSGVVAILFGPIIGIPYKIYAAYAHSVMSIFRFLLISIPARIVRFVLLTFATPYIIDKLLPNAPYMLQVQVVLILWVIFYSIYFVVKRKLH